MHNAHYLELVLLVVSLLGAALTVRAILIAREDLSLRERSAILDRRKTDPDMLNTANRFWQECMRLAINAVGGVVAVIALNQPPPPPGLYDSPSYLSVLVGIDAIVILVLIKGLLDQQLRDRLEQIYIARFLKKGTNVNES